jgi:hypothetical protein
MWLRVKITIPEAGEVIEQPQSAEESVELNLPDGVNVGDLLKIPDVTTVYFIDGDKKRHVFPNEPTYFSYFSTFKGIKIVPLSILAQIPLGHNVTVRPGTWLVKIQTDPKVYVVEPFGVLHYVSTPELAVKLYGSDWTNEIIDISSAFFVDYEIGEDIKALSHPSQTVLKYSNSSDIYYIAGEKKRLVSSEVFTNNKFQSKFIQQDFDQGISYSDGIPLEKLKIEDIIDIK